MVPTDITRLQFDQIDINREIGAQISAINKYNDQIDADDLNGEALVAFSKNYSKMDKLAATLETQFLGGAMILLGGFQKAIAKQNLGMANAINNPEAIQRAQETYHFASGQYNAAINYNDRLQNQMRYNYPQALELGTSASRGEYILDTFINSSPSILSGLATLPFGWAGAAAQRFSMALLQSSFFVLEAGGKLAEDELTRLHAPAAIAALEDRLAQTTDIFEKREINASLASLEGAMSVGSTSRGFIALGYGLAGAYAERFGTTAIFANFGKMRRGIGQRTLQKVVGRSTTKDFVTRNLAKGTGIGVGVLGGAKIELIEETLTQFTHNGISIIGAKEDKSLIDGIDPNFFANVVISTLAIQGSGVANATLNLVTSEVSSMAEQAKAKKLQTRLIEIKKELLQVDLSWSQKNKLHQEARGIKNQASELLGVSAHKLSRMGEADIKLLFEIGRQARLEQRAAKELGDQGEIGAYSKKRLQQAQTSYDNLMQQRESLIGAAQAKREAEFFALIKGQGKSKPGTEAPAKVNLNSDIKITPEIQYNIGLYDFATNLVKNTEGVTVVELNTQEKIEEYIRNSPAIKDDKRSEAFAYVDGNVIVVNTANINNAMLAGNSTNARIAAVAALHELGHIRTRDSGKLNDPQLQKNKEKIAEELKVEMKVGYEEGSISKDAYDTFLARMELYSNQEGGVDIDEVFQMINDFTNIGVLKDYGLSEMYSIKSFVNNALRFFVGDAVQSMGIETVADARGFVGSYMSKVNGVLTPAEAAEVKFSLDKANEDIKRISKSDRLANSTNAVYNANLNFWKDNNERRKSLAIERVLGQSESYMALMKSYAIKRGFTGVDGFNMEDYLDFAYSELAQHIANFNTKKGENNTRVFEEKSDDLHGWINSQANNKATSAFNLLGLEAGTTISMEAEGVEKKVGQVNADEQPEIGEQPKDTSLEKALKASATNFIREVNKQIGQALPGFLNGDVIKRFEAALSKFLNDPANVNKLRFEKVAGANKIKMNMEDGLALQKLLADYLIEELSEYFRNTVLKSSKGAFDNAVKSSFKIYKLIPQFFLNKKIPTWTEPLLRTDGPKAGTQARVDTKQSGAAAGKKANPLSKRIELTEEQWIRYWLNPTAPASTKTKLKRRFGEMIAAGVGTDMFIRFLNETDESNNLVNLQKFVDQQGLPAIDGKNAYSLVLIEALDRDLEAFNVKYSLGFENQNQSIAFRETISDAIGIVDAMSDMAFADKRNIDSALRKFYDPKIFSNKIVSNIADFFATEYAKRRVIVANAVSENKITQEDEAELMKEALIYKAYQSPLEKFFGISPKALNVANHPLAARNAITEIVDSGMFTAEQLYKYIFGSVVNGTVNTLVATNKFLGMAIGNEVLGKIGLKLIDDKFWAKADGSSLPLRGINISGNNLVKAFKKGTWDSVQAMQDAINAQAEEAREIVKNILSFYIGRLEAAGKDEKAKAVILQEAGLLFKSMGGYSNSVLRKMAKLRYIQEGLLESGMPAYFEHNLQVNIINRFIGLYLNGQITQAEMYAEIDSSDASLMSSSLATEIDAYIKNNQPGSYALGDDSNVRLKMPFLKVAMKGVVLVNPSNPADKIDGNTDLNKAAQTEQDKSIEKYNDLPYRAKTIPYSLNTDINLKFYGSTNEYGETKYKSDLIKIGPLKARESYFISLVESENNNGDPLVYFSFGMQGAPKDTPTGAILDNFKENNINPVRLFGAIGNSVIRFLKQNNEFASIQFSGSGASRIRLYDRLSSMMAEKLGWELFTDDVYSEDSFGNEFLDIREYSLENPSPTAKYSLNNLNKDFNLIIEDKFGVKEYKRFSEIVGKRRGANKGKFKLMPPSAQDFMGLMYGLLGKGKQGDAQKKWMEDNLVMPYAVGVAMLDRARQAIKRTYRNLIVGNPGVAKLLRQKISDGTFTYDQAVRVYLWNLNGETVPGLSERDTAKLVLLVKESVVLMDFANQLLKMANMESGWVKPSQYWDSETLLSDLNNLTQGQNRKAYIAEFIKNADIIFSKENKNKLRAVLGNDWVEALEDILFSMQNGTNRPSGSSKQVNAWMNWINRSVGAIMFFNRRSALLQLMSTVNFINWTDNNPFMAAAAFANQPQYWKDWVMIFNSPKLKERRGGLRTDVSEAEIANAASGSKNSPNAILSYLLKIGFLPTQIADSFAIASGGATFYRNRVNTYIKQGLTEKEAEEKAFMDFSLTSDVSQQSSDPMLISQEQRSVLGRLILNFQNTAAQYTRTGQKRMSDLINGRGDFKTNLSQTIYYTTVQNIIFGSLQNALFAFIPGFDDDDDELFYLSSGDYTTGDGLTEKEMKARQDKEAKSYARMINGSLDTILRGMGVRGAVVATLKNTILKFLEQENKENQFFRDDASVVFTAANISPPVGSKLTKFYSALRTRQFEKDVIAERGLDFMIDGKFKPSPLYSVVGNVAAAFANIPLDRAYDEVVSIAEAFDARNSKWQRLALALGYKSWTVGAKFEEEDLIKVGAKAVRKKEGIEKGKKTREENRRKKEEKERKLKANMSIDEYIEYLKNN